MNKHLRSLLISSSLCLTLIVTSIACDKHNSNNAENDKKSVENHKNKKFDYSKVTKNLPESVKKEVNEYHSKINSEYDKLSEEGKKAVAKISQYKKNAFAKKGTNAKKKNSNS